MPKYQDDSLVGQPIARDGLSRYAFGSRVRELECKFICQLFGVFVSKTTCIRLGERGEHVTPQE